MGKTSLRSHYCSPLTLLQHSFFAELCKSAPGAPVFFFMGRNLLRLNKHEARPHKYAPTLGLFLNTATYAPPQDSPAEVCCPAKWEARKRRFQKTVTTSETRRLRVPPQFLHDYPGDRECHVTMTITFDHEHHTLPLAASYSQISKTSCLYQKTHLTGVCLILLCR